MLRTITLLFLGFISIASVKAEFAEMKHSSVYSWKSQLRTGQILTTESSDPLQLPTLLGAERFSPFIHLGVVEVTASGDKYVYDTTATIGKYFLEGKSPADTMEGNVRRLGIDEFLEKYRVINIFTPPARVDISKLMTFIRQHWKDKTPFDPYFNLDEKKTLYCSEFIALGLEYAGGKKILPAAMRHNPSLDVIRRWMKINTPKFLFPYQLVEPGNWVGTVSLDHNRPTLLTERLVKYELYQRFTSNQKIGNVLHQSGLELTIREPVKQFSIAAHQMSLDSRFITTNLNKLSREVRRIADKILGPAASHIQTKALPRCQLDLRLCAS